MDTGLKGKANYKIWVKLLQKKKKKWNKQKYLTHFCDQLWV